MLKLLAKIAEKYARSTNTASIIWFAFHQPKMPASLIKKDQLKTKLISYIKGTVFLVQFL